MSEMMFSRMPHRARMKCLFDSQLQCWLLASPVKTDQPSNTCISSTVHRERRSHAINEHYSHISGEDTVDQILLWQVKGALQLVVVKGDFS